MQPIHRVRHDTLAAEAPPHVDKLQPVNDEAWQADVGAVRALVLFFAGAHVDGRRGVVHGETRHMIKGELCGEDGR